MSFPKYPAYKESGVEWIREVPLGWKLERLKCSVLECKNGVWGQDPQFDEDDITCVRVADFDREKLNVSPLSLTVRNIKQKDTIGREVEFGDLLIEKSGGGEKQPVGCVVFYSLNYKSVCSNFIARIKTSNLFSNKYLLYVHKFLYDSGVTVRSIKQTSGIQNLDQNSYLNEEIPVPPLPEQQAIASFLDRECGKIDALIAEQERLIALLAEKRQAVISHAVTKGLNPNAPMKDSGIPWIGMVPEGWEVVRLSLLSDHISSGTTPDTDNEDFYNGDICWVTTGELREGAIKNTTKKITNLALKKFSALQIYPPGTLLLAMYGATVGRIAWLETHATTNQACCALVFSKKMKMKFAFYTLLAAKKSLLLLSSGGGQPNINQEKVRSFRIPVPSLSEQNKVISFLDSNMRDLDNLATKIEKALLLLKERRAALISAAVTGKIDVRAQSKALAA